MRCLIFFQASDQSGGAVRNQFEFRTKRRAVSTQVILSDDYAALSPRSNKKLRYGMVY